MQRLQVITRLDHARALWRANVPEETVFDMWDAREAFHRRYRRPLRFLFGDGAGADRVFLPLSWVEEKNAWCCFPGETWSNATWLEQNRLAFGGLDQAQLEAALGAAFHLRYLPNLPEPGLAARVDETGYLFHPARCGCEIDNWWASFSRKKTRRLRRELRELQKRGATVCEGGVKDFDRMVEMSFERFGSSSYFADPRFREGFRDLLDGLARRGMLRATAVAMGGQRAAVDFGAVHRGRCTLLAGAADVGCPGVAKLINLDHLQWACRQRLHEVDFLCGDFSWKALFHLTPRPLYLATSLPDA